MRARRFATAALVLGPVLLLAAQTQKPVFRSGVELVDVAVVVTDRDGRFVPGLTAADFRISERGVSQTITAFDRVSIPVWRADAAAPAPIVPADVATNERPGDGRLFVLVLDALHVAPENIAGLRLHARRFIEQYVGPSDLVAVLSPGAIDEATEDFTSDKARLIAAITRFSGTKLRSATLELEAERQAAAVTGVVMHGGKDPSDSQRVDRVWSLSSVLEALAGHLGRVERRRKAVLLFSEGIDYNIVDVMGGVQKYSNDVVRAMERAVGALMRTNVSLYAIDPRGLAAGNDTTGEQLPFRDAPNAPRVGGSIPRPDFSEPSLEGEYSASIQSLRHVAESTGGFAALTSTDPAAAFERIALESSDYYILGYTPSTRGRPGEFRPIRVQVSRPGVRVIARNGYVVPSGPERNRAVEPSAVEPTMPSAFARPRSGRVEMPATPEAPAPRPSGLSEELAALLSSPLPVSGLSLRLQAAPFKGSEKKQLVQIVTEVLGSSLVFVERGGRFESRVELASFTVDSRGRGENGRSTTIDLHLTPEEFQRAKTAGIRWLSQLELAPGRYQLRVAGRARGSGAVGLVTVRVDVPSFADASVSGVALTSPPSALMVTRGKTRLASLLGTPPTAARTFVAGDRVVAGVEVYLPASRTAGGVLTTAVERAGGGVALTRDEKLPDAVGRARTAEVGIEIDTSSMSPGRYLLRIRLEGARPASGGERVVPFEIVPNAGEGR